MGPAGLHVADGKRRHAGTVGSGLRDDAQNQGTGRALLNALLDVADNYLALVRVDLEVLADNPRAIHLYETLGFETEGRKRKGVFRGGAYVDVLMMARLRG